MLLLWSGRLVLVRADIGPAKCQGGLSDSGVSLCRRLERFGFRRVARRNHQEGGGNWRHGGVRLRCPRDARIVANLRLCSDCVLRVRGDLLRRLPLIPVPTAERGGKWNRRKSCPQTLLASFVVAVFRIARRFRLIRSGYLQA
jgi:hypothetical protein